MESNWKWTWEKLTKIEPALQDLHQRIRDAVEDKRLSFVQACHLWYGPPGESGFKREMYGPVGMGARNLDIVDSGAYSTAYRKLFFDTIMPVVIEEEEN